MQTRSAVSSPQVKLSSPDKVLWPAARFTKGQVLDYYSRVAPAMLPHLAGRPLTLGRFPNGVEERGFAQVECRGRPDWLGTAAIRLRNGQVRNFCLARDRASLLWIANLCALELHVFLGLAGSLNQPTAVLFDLDPVPPATLGEAAQVAVLLRERLAAGRLSAVVKTTGGAGLHVLVPLNSSHEYGQTRSFARRIADELADKHERVTASSTPHQLRSGQVLIDWAQNSERRTFVAPYSMRADDAPMASTPVSWTEVERGDCDLRFGPDEVLDRLERLGDLFEPAITSVQRIG